MARVADPEAPVESTGESTGVEQGAKKGSNNIQVNLPAELKALVTAKSEELDKSVSGWVASLIARELGYDLPLTHTRERARKYATEEERKAAQAERAREKNSAITALVEAAKRGDIAGLDPKVKALLGI